MLRKLFNLGKIFPYPKKSDPQKPELKEFGSSCNRVGHFISP